MSESETLASTAVTPEKDCEANVKSHMLQNEPSFHSKSSLSSPCLPIRSRSFLGTIWRSLSSSLRMTIYRMLLWIGKRRFPSGSYLMAHRLPFDMYCKFDVGKAEVLAMLFVAENTTILVPRIIDVVGQGDSLFVLMTRVPGQRVAGALQRMDPPSLATFEADLRDWLFQLRSLTPPSNEVSSICGTASMQWRISTSKPLGPFANKDAFHEDLLSRAIYRGPLEPKMLKSYNKPHRICFTHGDLTPGNLLISNGRLSGLVDWGSSGWFPEYWEYTGACYAKLVHYPAWVGVFHRIFPQYRDELEADIELWDQVNPHY